MSALMEAAGLWGLLALAMFGLTQMVHLLTDWWVRSSVTGAISPTVLVLVQNQAERVEGTVRQVVHLMENARGLQGSRLIIAHLGSTDETGAILAMLQREYPALGVVDLNPLEATPACEQALFLSRHPVTLLIDLRHRFAPHEVVTLLKSFT